MAQGKNKFSILFIFPNFRLIVGSEIKLTLGGDCIVTFVKSNDDNDFVRVKYPLNSTPITMDVSEESVVITNHDKVSVNDSDFKNFKDSIKLLKMG